MTVVLVTSARAPVAMEWVRILRRDQLAVLLCDSLDHPIAYEAFKGDEGVRYQRVPAPVEDFKAYEASMQALISQVDLVIPTCEDIFHLAKVALSPEAKKKCWMPDRQLLLQLHHKEQVFSVLPVGTGVHFPQTSVLTSPDQVRTEELAHSILKPVFSRFGRQVLLQPDLAHLPEISATSPWVQQEKLVGQAYCNYALCEHGKVVAHAVYEPKHLLNGSASTYFKRVSKPAIDAFVTAFAAQHHYHGQVAFDFIETQAGMYVIECNPRSTSGLHLVADHLRLKDGRFLADRPAGSEDYSLGRLLYLVSGASMLFAGKWRNLTRDIQQSTSIFRGIAKGAIWSALTEMVWLSLTKRVPLTDVSTHDIEYNGDIDEEF